MCVWTLVSATTYDTCMLLYIVLLSNKSIFRFYKTIKYAFLLSNFSCWLRRVKIQFLICTFVKRTN